MDHPWRLSAPYLLSSRTPTAGRHEAGDHGYAIRLEGAGVECAVRGALSAMCHEAGRVYCQGA